MQNISWSQQTLVCDWFRCSMLIHLHLRRETLTKVPTFTSHEHIPDRRPWSLTSTSIKLTTLPSYGYQLQLQVKVRSFHLQHLRTKSLVSQHISVWRKGARGNACPTHHTPAFLFTSKNRHPRFSSSECSVSQVSSMLTHLCLTGLQHNVHELKSVEGYIQR